MKRRNPNLLLIALMIIVPLSQVSLATEVRRTQQKPVTAKEHSEKAIKLEIVLNAPVEKVWKAWTTKDGIRSFFAPDCDIDLRVLGKYDILFAPDAARWPSWR